MVAPTEHKKQEGFTLVEIMVVVVIVGILATLVAQNVFGSTEQAKLDATRSDIDAIAQAADRYRLTHGNYPEEMSELVEESEGGIQYLKVAEEPTDKWTNTEYRLEREGAKLVVRCAGFDGEFDTEDDITSQNMQKLNIEEYLKIINQSSN